MNIRATLERFGRRAISQAASLSWAKWIALLQLLLLVPFLWGSLSPPDFYRTWALRAASASWDPGQLFTSALLNINLLRLLSTSAALWFFGTAVEQIVSTQAMLLTFAGAQLAGAIFLALLGRILALDAFFDGCVPGVAGLIVAFTIAFRASSFQMVLPSHASKLSARVTGTSGDPKIVPIAHHRTFDVPAIALGSVCLVLLLSFEFMDRGHWAFAAGVVGATTGWTVWTNHLSLRILRGRVARKTSSSARRDSRGRTTRADWRRV